MTGPVLDRPEQKHRGSEPFEQDMDMPVGEEEGWQIARASFTREAVHYSVRGGIALVILSAIVFAGFWIVDRLQHLPPSMVNSAKQMFDPVLKNTPFSSTPVAPAAATTSPVVVAPKVHTPVKHVRKHRKPQGKPSHGHVKPVQAGDDPTGGRIIYSDGMITEYSWK